MAFYCVTMAGWSSLFLEMWKRQQATCALEWDMRDFEETQRPRAQFKASKNGLFEPFMSKNDRYTKPGSGCT